MEESIQTTVAPEHVWAAWEKAHALHEMQAGVPTNASFEGVEAGQDGRQNRFRYKLLDLKKGESFSILWKTLFVRLIFTQSVKRHLIGSEIFYRVQIKGLFAWPVRMLLGSKIKKNIGFVLKAIVKQLEREG